MMRNASIGRAALLTAASAAALAGWTGAAQAGGFYLQEQSVKATGRAFSGEAADQGAESLWWNPAAIAGNAKSTAYLGASAILPSAKVNNVGTTIRRPGQTAFVPVGGNGIAKDPIDNGVLPSGAVAVRLNDQWSVGLAVTSPYSFSTNYDANAWSRYSADKTKLTTIDLQPTIAFAPSPMFGIGVGVNVEHSDATLSNALPNVLSTLPDGSQTLKGKGWDVGYSVGLQVHPSEIIDFGLSYKSSIKHTLKGDVVVAGLLGPLAANNRTVSTTAKFQTPWQATASVRVKATEGLTLNAQVVRLGWNKFDAIDLGAPLNTALPEDYRNTWSVAGGWDFAMTPQWTLRGGVQWDQTPTQNGARDARVPDSNRINFALGTSYQISDGITIDAAANYIDFKNATIDRNTIAAGSTILTSGRVTGASAIVLALGGRMSF